MASSVIAACANQGTLVNHGGGLQDDGQGYANCGFAYVFLFERGTTLFQISDPKAASYFKWAAKQVWRASNPGSNFPEHMLFSVVFGWREELKQLNASGGVPIPMPADDDPAAAGMSSKVVHKNEYQHDKNHTNGGPVPKKLVVCPSRNLGVGYVQQDIYSETPGYHVSQHKLNAAAHRSC